MQMIKSNTPPATTESIKQMEEDRLSTGKKFTNFEALVHHTLLAKFNSVVDKQIENQFKAVADFGSDGKLVGVHLCSKTKN